jgi:LCP family protein required for cell wall assembly
MGPQGAGPQRRGAHAARRTRWREPRRARSTAGGIGLTLLGALLPGAGLLWCRRWIGLLLFVPTLGGAALAVVRLHELHDLVAFAVDPVRLRTAAGIVAAFTGVWMTSVVATYVLARPKGSRWGATCVGGTAVLALCLGLAAPGFVATRYALVQADLVSSVFEHNKTATAPKNVTKKNPWGDQRHVSVLLLGGDGGVGRTGVRTDSVILMRMDTHNGNTVMFSLPRNMMNAQFPDDSPLHALYPDGFRGEGDPGNWMLNAIYGQVPALHPGILGASDNEGADAIKQAVSGSLGVAVDYYILVNLRGFQRIVDAMGGVTVNINQRVAVGGSTSKGIPPDAWLEPGPDQHLDGYHALWFSRGRYGSDDYQRMLRQRCMIKALIDEARPVTLVRRYVSLAAAGKEVVRTDIPAALLPSFVDLGLRVKDAALRSIAFVSSPEFVPGDPDFEWLRAAVKRALKRPDRAHHPKPSTGPTAVPTDSTPGEESPVEVAQSCEYRPTG